MWTAAACPRVLRARASGGGLFDGAALGAHVRAIDGVEHVALPHRAGLVRIDVVEGTVRDGPVMLAFDIRHGPHFAAQLDAARLFDAISRGLRPRRAPRDARLRRAALALRAYDARMAGASLREIAVAIVGTDDWPGPGDCVKSAARRLVAAGERLVAGGPRPLLDR